MDMLIGSKIQAITELASKNLAIYDARVGLVPGNDSGTWDMLQAARLSEDVRALLEIVAELQASA